jgi:hypothetical protein
MLILVLKLFLSIVYEYWWNKGIGLSQNNVKFIQEFICIMYTL